MSDADLRLGLLYQAGRGVERNYQQALQRYQRAADAGYVEALYRIAVFYDEGLGVDRDSRAALQWYVKAADRGHAEADALIQRLMKPVEREGDAFSTLKFRKF